MADEARLVVELLDRGGSAGQASASASAPGSADVAGASLAQDTHDRITAQGAGASLGSGSIASPAPKGGDPLVPAVAGLVAADPTITPKELGAALGIPDSRAEALLEASRAKPTSSSSPVPEGSSGGPSMPRRGDIDWVASGLESPKPDIELPLDYRSGRIGDITGPTYAEGFTQADAKRMEQMGLAQAPKTAADIAIEAEVVAGRVATPKEAQQAVNLAAGVASQFGPIGGAVAGVAQTAAAIPGVLPALSNAMSPITPALPYIGTALAVAAIPSAAYAMGDNEANRARLLIESFSPEVVSAESEASIRQLLANQRTAERLGDEVADIITAKSQLSSNLQGVRDVVSEPILREFRDVVKALDNAARLLNEFAQSQTGGAILQGAVSGGFLEVLNTLGIKSGFLYGVLGALEDRNKRDLAKDNPLRFYLDKPMPAWPAPFNEVGEGRPIQGAEFAPIPGLNL